MIEHSECHHREDKGTAEQGPEAPSDPGNPGRCLKEVTFKHRHEGCIGLSQMTSRGKRVPGRGNSAQSSEGKSEHGMCEGLMEAEYGSSTEYDQEKDYVYECVRVSLYVCVESL